MDYICAMKEIQCAKHIIHYSHHVLLLERISFELTEDAVEVHVNAIHHKEDVVEFVATGILCLLHGNKNVQ